MNRYLLGALTIAATTLSAPAVRAETHTLPQTGTEFSNSLKTCQAANVSPDDIPNWRACNGYLTGILNGEAAALSITNTKPIFCIPANTSDQQIQDGLIAFIDSNPAVGASPAVAAIFAAMMKIFPCK